MRSIRLSLYLSLCLFLWLCVCLSLSFTSSPEKILTANYSDTIHPLYTLPYPLSVTEGGIGVVTSAVSLPLALTSDSLSKDGALKAGA